MGILCELGFGQHNFTTGCPFHSVIFGEGIAREILKLEETEFFEKHRFLKTKSWRVNSESLRLCGER